MNYWQNLIVWFFGISGLITFLFEILRLKNKKSVYTLTDYLFFLGAFVWGDIIILGPFWIIVSLVSIYLNSWNLFLTLVSLFWSIRSFGEIVYWLNEQFGGKNRNPPHTLKLYKYIKNDAVWFLNQLFWECIFVFSILLSLYFSKLLLFG